MVSIKLIIQEPAAVTSLTHWPLAARRLAEGSVGEGRALITSGVVFIACACDATLSPSESGRLYS